jgi:hypothetical protein
MRGDSMRKNGEKPNTQQSRTEGKPPPDFGEMPAKTNHREDW